MPVVGNLERLWLLRDPWDYLPPSAIELMSCTEISATAMRINAEGSDRLPFVLIDFIVYCWATPVLNQLYNPLVLR